MVPVRSMMYTLLASVVLFSGVCDGKGRNINHTSTLISTLLTNYDKRLLPVLDTSDQVAINISFALGMIRDFNDVSGELSFLGRYTMIWYEERFVWDPRHFAEISEVVLPKEDVWYPELEMPTSLNSYAIPGNTAKKVRFRFDGLAHFDSMDLVSVICSADVKYYPFDSQKCLIYVLLSGYSQREVHFRLIQQDTSATVITENSEWKVNVIEMDSHGDSFSIKLNLQRRETYIMMTLQTPIQLLGLLNPWVFLLRPESGERVSFSITAFLAFTVYLGVLTEHIPKGSTPIPDVLYEVFINLIYSTLILFCTILSLWLHLNDANKPVPTWIQIPVRLLSCSCFRRSRIVGQDTNSNKGIATSNSGDSFSTQRMRKLSHQLSMNKIPEENLPEVCIQTSQNEHGRHSKDEVTWSRAGNVFDRVMLVVFYIIFITVTTVYNVDKAT